MSYEIAPLQPADWRQVRQIFADGIATGVAGFWPKPPIWRDWHAGHLETGRLVARTPDSRVAGWSALSPAPDT